MSNYTSSAINYYRVNANNTAIAISPLGATGTQPTEEIAAPLASAGTFSSYTILTRTIAGSATVFTNFAVDQYLYYTNPTTGNYVLVGQILTITNNTTIVLTTAGIVNDPAAVGTPVLSAAYSLITSNESIYMRIATNTSSAPPNGMLIPNFSTPYWRQGNGLTGLNNPSQSALERISPVGTPLSNATSENIPFTFTTMNQFDVSGSNTILGTLYFRSSDFFPSYIWILVTPEIGTNTSLSSQTLYRFTTQENTEAIAIAVQTPGTTLRDAGYNNIATSSGGGNNEGN
jgi:hypothetical protein